MDIFTQQQYLNLETFRKNGVGVKTPVWFVQDGETLFIRTVADSGKVKRIRSCQKVNVAPCKGNGTVVGPWGSALAREVKDAAIARKVDSLLDKKYGLMKKLFALVSTLQGKKYTILEIRIGESY